MTVEFLGPIANISLQGTEASSRMIRERSQDIELGIIVSCNNAHPPFSALVSILPEHEPYIETHEEGSQISTLIITTEFAAMGFIKRAAKRASRKRHPSAITKILLEQLNPNTTL